MKSTRNLFLIIIIILSATSQFTNAQEKVNKTPQQIKERQANYDALIADLTNLATLAQQHYRKPVALGGGGNKFTGWFIPEVIDTTANGMFTAIISKDSVLFAGTGNVIGNDGKNRIRVFMVVYPNMIKSMTIHN